MPTSDQEIALIYGRTVELANLADAAYQTARADLTALAAAIPTIPASLVNVTIGTDAAVSWSATWAAPDAPEEPDFSSALPDAPTVPDVTVPDITVGDPPSTDVDLSGEPAALDLDPFSDLPTLGPLPPIDAAIPSLDVGLLESGFAWSEPVYVERLAPDVQAGISRVLAGNLGIPQPYWDSLWAAAQADLVEQARTKLRDTNLRGAPSYWQLPGEALLASQRRADDEVSRALSAGRLKQAHEQAVLAREDFWQAISQAIAYENAWLNAHQQAAARALTAAEQLHRVRVDVHNANIARFNLILERAKAIGVLQDLEVQRALREYAAWLQGITAELERARTQVQIWQGEWQGYQISKDVRLRAIATEVQAWNNIAEAQARAEKLRLDKGALDVQSYTAQLGAIDGIARATAAVLSARASAYQAKVSAATAGLEFDKAKNAAVLDQARLDQAAQEVLGKLDIMQAEWAVGQSHSLQQRIAELSFGFAQAAVAASDISYGRNVNLDVTANQNNPLAW